MEILVGDLVRIEFKQFDSVTFNRVMSQLSDKMSIDPNKIDDQVLRHKIGYLKLLQGIEGKVYRRLEMGYMLERCGSLVFTEEMLKKI